MYDEAKAVERRSRAFVIPLEGPRPESRGPQEGFP